MRDTGSDEIDVQRDAVTGLPALDSVRRRLEDWLRGGPGADGGDRGAAVPSVHAVLLGLRRIDTVNLAFGAAAGDGGLAEVANRMAHFAGRELDGPWLLARGGGGTFLLVSNEPCSRESWQLFAAQMAEIVARPIAVPAGILRLSPQLALLRGLAGEGADSVLGRLGTTLEGLTRQAGRRLAWADGELVRGGRSPARIEADLLGAIDRDEIDVVFQPQFAAADDRLSGAEALARWDHPTLGRVGAGALFAVAERIDHVVPLSRHIAAKALAAARDWPEHLRLSLNVTPADLAVEDFAGVVAQAVRASGFAPGRLTLEVTEQTLLYDIQHAARALGALAQQGIRVALDDFGAGFCNFRYLKRLPLHYLKLDRSMIDGITDDPRDLAVLRAIIAMAGALDLAVIAEGIEQEAQRKLIAAEGCAFYQGFLRARPMAADRFADLARGA